MTHEHLIIDFTCMFAPPEGAGQRARAFEPITMENLGWINYDWTRHYENLLLTDVEMAVEETQRYRDLGGGTLVDATTMGIGRDPVSLAQISRRTGLNVVMGAGYYVERVHPDEVGRLGVSEIAQRIVDEVLVGVGGTGVRAGIIGEIGCTWPLGDGERKVLAAAAAAQRETGAAVLIHPGARRGRAVGDPGGPGGGRGRPGPGDHGPPGQDHHGGLHAAGGSLQRLLPGVRPVRLGDLVLPRYRGWRCPTTACGWPSSSAWQPRGTARGCWWPTTCAPSTGW